MKKYLSILMVCIICFFVSGCTEKLTTYTELTYDNFKEKIENKDSFALFVGSNACSHCDDFKITIEKFVKEYQIEVFYIDIAKLSSEEYYEFTSVVNFGGSTPTTVFINEGAETNVYNRIVGALPYSKVVSKFEKAGYIKVK